MCNNKRWCSIYEELNKCPEDCIMASVLKSKEGETDADIIDKFLASERKVAVN